MMSIVKLLGNFSDDYSALIMKFTWQGQQLTLHHGSPLISNVVSLVQFQPFVHNDIVAIIFTLTYAFPEHYM